MEQTTLKIGLAGLIHDIGKFAQGCMEISRQYANDNADQYQPFFNNRHTHIHALYTAAFLEQFAGRLPDRFNAPDWGEGDSFINLAAGHHKPETPLQWIVTQADRISSGLDRSTFEQGEAIAFKDFKRTRLLPILESLDADPNVFAKADDFQYRYSLSPLSATPVFALQKQDRALQNNPEQEYQVLFDTFIEQLQTLQHRETDLELWAHHFDSLLRTCTALIPAARVGDVIHDVSLYDHSRTTAALAAALHVYHRDTDSLNLQSIRTNDIEKFLLVTGDFYGIQDFIFSTGGDMRKFRSKILRGRSFAVSLFSELASDMLCRTLGLPFLSVVLNAAGKFTIIAPNTPSARTTVTETERKLNEWLVQISCGQSSMGLTMTAAAPEEFYAGSYGALHDRHMQDIQARKRQKLDLERFGGAIEGYLESFDASLNSPLCGLCGKRPADAGSSKDHTVLGDSGVACCAICRDHVMLGAMIVKKERLTVSLDTTASHSPSCLRQPFFNTYQLQFTDTIPAKAARTVKHWQVNVNPDGSLFSDITMRPLNGYVPLYRPEDEHDGCLLESERKESTTLELIDQIRTGDLKTFSHIALKGKSSDKNGRCISGTEALAVLKADVDNLGLLLGCGLPEKQFTLSRLATLSRQLDAFFSIYLPTLLAESEDFRETYTVFAGGDDLFLIGPWNRMGSLALFLRKRFADYVCGNKGVTFSAGITLHKPHVPVDALAAAAEQALEQSKHTEGKNAVTMFGRTVSWPDLKTLFGNRQEMERWLDDRYISSAMMYRFNHLIDLVEKEQNIMNGDIAISDLDALKWRSMAGYTIGRNIDSSLKGEARKKAIQEVSLISVWLERYGAAMRIPLWHLLYDRR